MRLLKFDARGTLTITPDLPDNEHLKYAILSHTWGSDNDEVTFADLKNPSLFKKKPGYTKILFCGEQARRNGLEYFWVDTCSIDKTNHVELSEAITSMFRWYHNATRCYVFLSDVSTGDVVRSPARRTWKFPSRKSTQFTQGRMRHRADASLPALNVDSAGSGSGIDCAVEQAFRQSRWFTRGFTLQELIAPASVEFFSQEGGRIGDKKTLGQQIQEITGIPVAALHGAPLSQFSVDERLAWAARRATKKKEDAAYCLLGIFEVFMPLIYGEGDHAFVRLRNELGKSRRTSSPERGNRHWIVPRSANNLFTGRKDILDKLEEAVRAAVQEGMRTEQCRIVIWGLGGQGKSEISLQLVQRLRSLLWGVFWVDVSTPSSAENGFIDIANRFQIASPKWQDGQQALAHIARPWMLVLDNADDPDVDYQAYFPSGAYGTVVLTSRNADCEQYATAGSVALAELPEDDATELLLKAADVARDKDSPLNEDARAVAVLLHSHPLALIQAGAYVKRGHCSLAEYPQVYEQQRERLLKFRPAQARPRYRDVYATFEASVEVLQTSQTESSRDALELQPLLAVCAPNQLLLGIFEAAWGEARRIPSEYYPKYDELCLRAWHVYRLPSLIQASGEKWDSFRLMEAVHALKAFALVSTHKNHGQTTVSMHPLVHAWARDRQDERQRHMSWITMGCVLTVSSLSISAWDTYTWPLHSHFQAAISWDLGCMFRSEPEVMVVAILMRCGRMLDRMRDDATLFLLLERLCSFLGLDNSSVRPQWVRLYVIIASNLLRRGKVREAVRLREQMLQVLEKLEEDHPERLNSQEELATTYQANGQVKEAVTLLEEVVRVRERSLAESHADLLSSQRKLALAYLANRQVKKVVTLLEKTVLINLRTMGEDHPVLLHSQYSLALAWRKDGQVEEAVQLLEEVHELAVSYAANGHVQEAVTLLEKVVRIKTQTLREDDPDRLVSQHSLAIYLWELGERSTALQMMGHIVEIRKRVLDDHDPDRLKSQSNLALYLWEVGEHSTALPMMQHVVEIQKKVLEDDHPIRLASEYNLAVFLWEVGERSTALQMMSHVVGIRKRVLDHDHPERVRSEQELKYFEKNMPSIQPGSG